MSRSRVSRLTQTQGFRPIHSGDWMIVIRGIECTRSSSVLMIGRKQRRSRKTRRGRYPRTLKEKERERERQTHRTFPCAKVTLPRSRSEACRKRSARGGQRPSSNGTCWTESTDRASRLSNHSISQFLVSLLAHLAAVHHGSRRYPFTTHVSLSNGTPSNPTPSTATIVNANFPQMEFRADNVWRIHRQRRKLLETLETNINSYFSSHF